MSDTNLKPKPTPQQKSKYKTPLIIIIFQYIAAFIFTAGIIVCIASDIVYGIALMITAILLFVFGMIAGNIDEMNYLLSLKAEDDLLFHNAVFEHLRQIEENLNDIADNTTPEQKQ